MAKATEIFAVLPSDWREFFPSGCETPELILTPPLKVYFYDMIIYSFIYIILLFFVCSFVILSILCFIMTNLEALINRGNDRFQTVPVQTQWADLGTAMLSKSLWGWRKRLQMVKYFEMTQESPNLNTDDRILHILVCSEHAHANTEPHMLCKQLRLCCISKMRKAKSNVQSMWQRWGVLWRGDNSSL